MVGKELIIDSVEFDIDRPVASIEEIRRYNPQRYEMEQLTGILYEDTEKITCIGYKDVTDDEFWIRGHMPGSPLMPGVIMCEAAAQLASYYTQKHDLLGAEIVGFGGLEDVRFREMVYPGDRLVIALQRLKTRRGAVIICRFQGTVGRTLVVEGKIKGIPLPMERLQRRKKT